mmetsp:Transcript_3571/g.10083  ORF Transcript_3571/g.10083 Transcript_3571/m.10083 type:complete len:298 (+) Transcript_3571:656-1549(+)
MLKMHMTDSERTCKSGWRTAAGSLFRGRRGSWPASFFLVLSWASLIASSALTNESRSGPTSCSFCWAVLPLSPTMSSRDFMSTVMMSMGFSDWNITALTCWASWLCSTASCTWVFFPSPWRTRVTTREARFTWSPALLAICPETSTLFTSSGLLTVEEAPAGGRSRAALMAARGSWVCSDPGDASAAIVLGLFAAVPRVGSSSSAAPSPSATLQKSSTFLLRALFSVSSAAFLSLALPKSSTSSLISLYRDSDWFSRTFFFLFFRWYWNQALHCRWVRPALAAMLLRDLAVGFGFSP